MKNKFTFSFNLRKANFGFFALALLLALLLLPTTMLKAQTLTPPSAGDGTVGNPYQIATLDNLYWLSQTPAEWKTDNNFIQTADIDATSTASWDGGKGFKPIGSLESGLRFNANYDGNGKSISNLRINRPIEVGVGLFGYVSQKISNLRLINANITGHNNVGALVGYQNYGTVKRCSSSGIVSGTSRVGGLIGYANENIEQSYSSANVSVASSSGGGLVGSFEFGGSYYIKNCYATGSVTGSASAQNLGGLIGYVAPNNPAISTIQYCYSTGAVSATAGTDFGGLIGYLTDATVNSCYWDTETSTMATSAAGTPKTTVEMQTVATFIDWDFELIWAIIGNNYPTFDFSRPPTFSGGAGTIENPYLISSYKHLTQLSQFPELWGASFSQTSNIDASASATTPYDAIGVDPAFTGTYNGNNYSIDGLTNSFVFNPGGLFANIKTATISNINLTNAIISSVYMVGGIVGYAEASTITNCSVTGNISAVTIVGGVVGGATNTNINKCSANVVVGGLTMFGETNMTHFGGLVGLVNDVGTPITTISNSFAQGTVSAYNFVGGLVGGVDMGSSTFGGGGTPSSDLGFTMTNCYAANVLTASGGTPGGVFGQSNYVNSKNAITITNSFWDTEVSGTSISYIGGTGKTTAEMNTESTFTGWDFTTPVWSMKSTYNNGYPYLNGVSYTWDGSTDANWNTAENWTPEGVPEAADIVTIPGTGSGVTNWPVVNETPAIPAVCKYLTIESGAVLTIAAGKALTVNGNLANNAGITGLVVKSDGTGTGSLKILGSVSGGATIERDMSLDKWHMISSPTASQPIINFLTNNVDIATSAKLTEPHYEFAMSGYSAGSWSSFYLHDKPVSDLFEVGKGYRVLNWSPITQKLYFEGTLNTLPVASISVGEGWNLVGNPYTTAININVGLTSFVSVNSGLLPDSYAAAYFWDAATNKYIAVNDGYEDTNAPVGQGFFVKAGGAGTITFNSDMQVHDGSNVFKSSALPRPTINLIANNGTESAATLVKFKDGASKGLDVGYDAGIFKANPEFSLYTKLVEDNGIDFQLQYLPSNQYNNLVIPVGIDSKAAGEIVFTVETVQLAQDCKVILEDKLTNTFTDLSKESYKAAVLANTSTSERFFLHTGDIISGLEDQSLADGKLTAYAKGNKEIRVIGEVGEGAVATLVNGLGQVVLTKELGAGNLNIIGLPNLNSGVYLLNINDKGTPQTIKVMVRK